MYKTKFHPSKDFSSKRIKTHIGYIESIGPVKPISLNSPIEIGLKKRISDSTPVPPKNTRYKNQSVKWCSSESNSSTSGYVIGSPMMKMQNLVNSKVVSPLLPNISINDEEARVLPMKRFDEILKNSYTKRNTIQMDICKPKSLK